MEVGDVFEYMDHPFKVMKKIDQGSCLLKRPDGLIYRYFYNTSGADSYKLLQYGKETEWL